MSQFDLQRFIPAHVSGLKGYHAKEPVASTPEVLKLDLNECLVPPSPKVLQALRSALTRDNMLNWYPDSSCAELRRSIGRYLNVPAERLMVTNGSNMAMEVFARAFVGSGDPVLICSPVYDVFEVQCKLQQARIEHFYFSEPFNPDFDELTRRDEAYKLIYLANPNNPTGIGYPREKLLALLRKRRDTLVLLDEAYHEFYGVTVVDVLDEFPNLVILRSFSKAFSLAGMRCGYLVAQPSVLEVAARALAPWAVNGLTQVAAHAAIQDVDYMRAFVAECNQARRTLVDGLNRLGFVARFCYGNFILWQVPNPKKAVEILAARQVYVGNKDSVPQLNGHLRVTIGTTAQARRFLEIVTELCAEFSA
ncbi:MAG TPA: histidinol-phosphate transaminase [Verrucomicrobiae bacterium]|nr:histidinol-phosphate transaminase [Verrucomicrobiae bacterium]